MKVLKTAVVGLGRIGWRYHIPEIAKRPEQFQLVAVVDVVQERLEEAMQTYGANGYTDLGTMIEAEKPDLVVIASPTHLHEVHACTAMKMGCDVFLDKPMATDYDAARRIAECSADTGRKLMIYQPHRANPEANMLKHIIASGKLGKLCTLHVGRYGYSRRADWQAFKKFGGGMLNNYGAHYLDYMVYVTGEKIERLHCLTDSVASAGDAEDVVKVLGRTESGIQLELDINQVAALPGIPLAAYGSCGAAVLKTNQEGNKEFHLRYYDENAVPQQVASEELAAANRSYTHDVPLPWVEEKLPLSNDYGITFYENVYDFYALDKKPFVPVEQTLYVMDAIRRCREDAERA